MSASRLQLRGIGRAFNGVPVLEHIDLDVAPGAMLGLIGPNGAGKTTLFNILSGFVSSDSGSLRLDGQDIARMSPRARSRGGVVRTFQNSLIFPSLAVRDNVAMALCAATGTGYRWWGGQSARLAADMQARVLLGQSGLAARVDALAADLSYGEQRLLDVVIALAQTPRVLLLDEPTAGLSQAEAQQVLALVSEHRADASVVLISHDIDIVFGVCERVAVLDLGRLIAIDTPAAIRADARVLSAYLGMPAATLADVLEQAE